MKLIEHRLEELTKHIKEVKQLHDDIEHMNTPDKQTKLARDKTLDNINTAFLRLNIDMVTSVEKLTKFRDQYTTIGGQVR